MSTQDILKAAKIVLSILVNKKKILLLNSTIARIK